MSKIQRQCSTYNRMKPISQSYALGFIINNLSQPLCNMTSSASVKSFIYLTKMAECIKIGMKNGAFSVIIKKVTKQFTTSLLALQEYPRPNIPRTPRRQIQPQQIRLSIVKYKGLVGPTIEKIYPSRAKSEGNQGSSSKRNTGTA